MARRDTALWGAVVGAVWYCRRNWGTPISWMISIGFWCSILPPHEIKGLSEREPLYRSLDMRLFQITLPKFADKDEQNRAQPLKEILSAMEQFYAGMMSVADGSNSAAGKNYFTLEIALPHVGSEVSFYSAVPSTKTDLFAKQIQAVFPDAKIEEMPDDYNIFNDSGASVGARAVPSRSPVLPLKMYDEFNTDPLTVMLNAFAKIAHEGEGAAIQLIIAPAGVTL